MAHILNNDRYLVGVEFIVAKLFPDIAKSRVIFASSAEEKFYALCMQQLGSEWHVYYSCTLSTIESAGMADNEADFVLYHPKHGVIVIEVKGGRISYDASSDRYFSKNRHGQSFPIKNPFQQALVWKSRFIRFARKNNLRVPVTHAVCFPSVNENEIPVSAEVEPAIIIGQGKMENLEQSLIKMVQVVQPEKFMGFEDCSDKLSVLLKSDSYATKHHFRDYIDGHEKRLKDLEFLHDTFVRPITSSKRLGIEGEAGTGKTLLACLIAKHFRDSGKRVLFLSTNDLLNIIVRRDFGTDIDVSTYTETALSYGVDLLNKPESYEGSKADWIQIEGPSRLQAAMAEAQKKYDVIVCDEAQDVQPFWWECYEHLLKDEDSRFYIFFDRGQGVFGSGDDESFVPEEVLPVAAPYFPLVHNYRTTNEIAQFARKFRAGTNIISSHSERLGYLPKIIVYKDKEDAFKKLEELIRGLTMVEGIKPEECTLLSARKPDADVSIIRDREKISGIKLNYLYQQKKKRSAHVKGEIAASTVSMFKGLETSVGILLNFSEYNLPATHPIMASLIYVACTRAKHMLYVFVKEGEGKDQHFLSALSDIHATGAVTANDDRADYHYLGRVTHFNSNRYGMLTVDDPTFERGRIMFFPADIERSLHKQIKAGTQLKFRPVQDGDILVASELELLIAKEDKNEV